MNRSGSTISGKLTVPKKLFEVEGILSRLEKENSANLVKQCGANIKDLEEELDMFEFEISNMARAEELEAKQLLVEFQSRFRAAKTKFDILKDPTSNDDAEKLFSHRKNWKHDGELENKDIKALDQDQLIAYGQNIQEKGLEKLIAMEGLLEEDIAMADQINAELDEQIRKLDEIQAETMDIQTHLKRTGKLIKYFAKQVSGDKFLLCLIITIVLIIISLIIVRITSKSSSNATPAGRD